MHKKKRRTVPGMITCVQGELYKVTAAPKLECNTCDITPRNRADHSFCPGTGYNLKRIDPLYEDLLKVKEMTDD